MKFEFKKATRKKSKLRMLISGTSGSGKTYSSLLIASGMGKKIAVIDTERGSASLYSNLVDFDVLELPDFTVDTYISAINQAAKLGYEIIILDTITPVWDQIKEDVEQAAAKSKSGNTFSEWGRIGTPSYKRFIEAIMSCPCHIIACTRAKTEYVLEEYEKNGFKKQRPRKVGLTPEQKGNIEYEFTLAIMMDSDNTATFIKDRTGKFIDRSIDKPGIELGNELSNWLNEGEEISLATEEQLKIFHSLCTTLNYTEEQINRKLEGKGFYSKESLPSEEIQKFINSLEDAVKAKIAKETQGAANAS